MKRLLIFPTIMLLTPLFFASAFTYSRSPLGTSVANPVTFTVTLTQVEMNSIGVDLDPTAAFWCIQPNDLSTSITGFSESKPINQLSGTFSMILQTTEYSSVAVYTAPSSTCTNENVFGGGFNVEGDNTSMVFSTAGSPGSIVSPKMPITTIIQPETAFNFDFNQNLAFGSKGEDVKKMQEFLAREKTIYPEGLVTGYFGSLTQKAVERFQIKYGIVSGGTPATTGFGLVGPRTRAKLNELRAK